MDIQQVLSLLGGLALFLYGMTSMSNALETISSGRLERVLERLTSNVFKGILLGALVTAVIQSSSATTVMCVGFVNAGIMKLSQTVGIIMGANIGTTITAQLLSLGDISTDNLLLLLLKPSTLGPLLAFIGITLYMFVGKGTKKIVGQAALGLGMIFIGMKSMEGAVSGLKDIPAFQDLFLAFSNPLLGLAAGALVTALIQSSSASVGILQALTTTGLVSFNVAMPLIFGQNIGTCITAMISSIGASKNAKRTAMLHLSFNLIGSLFFLGALYGVNAAFDLPFWTMTMSRGSIANFHLAFNIGCTLLLLPFHKLLVVLVEKLIRGDSERQEFNMLDERFLASPSLALEKARETVVHMGCLARDNYARSIALIQSYDEKAAEQFHEDEAALDRLEVTLDNYLVKLTDRALTTEESMLVSELLHTLSDFERVGDYAENVKECATVLHQRGWSFSADAQAELDFLTGAVSEILDLTVRSYDGRVRSLAVQVEPLEEVVDLMRDTLRDRHVERLKSNGCTVDLGIQFLELIINLERISDHCSAVALFVVRDTAPAHDLAREDAHAYLHQLHHTDAPEYTEAYSAYKEKYFTPIA